MTLTCPTCGASEFLSKLLSGPDAPAIPPGTLVTCPDCMELAFTTGDGTLRKATGLERRDIMRDPQKREIIEGFAALAMEYRRLKEQMR